MLIYIIISIISIISLCLGILIGLAISRKFADVHYMTNLAEQLSDKIIHNIRGGLNGISNKVDKNYDLLNKNNNILYEVSKYLLEIISRKWKRENNE